MKEDCITLDEALKDLNKEQMMQFMCIAASRALPFYNKEFINIANERGYLTLLFLSLETCRSLCAFGSATHANNISSCEINSAFVQALERDRIRDLENIHTYTHDNKNVRAFAITYALAHALDPNYDRDHEYRALLLIRDLNRTLSYTLDYESNLNFNNILFKDALLLRENRNDEISNATAWYGEVWKEWLKTLRELGGGYWADWYVRLFENRFLIKDKAEIKRHLTLPKELWNIELRVSAQWLMKLALPGGVDRYLNEARVILLGEKGSGKTSLARRLLNPNAPMPSKQESTEGVNITSVKLSKIVQGIPRDRDANVHIWDFAGHAITHAMHRFFLSERCLYIIVYDGRTEGRNRLSYWLDHVRNYGGTSRVIVLVNLQDEHSPDIPEKYLMERYSDNRCEFIRFSIKDDTIALQNFRERLANIIAADPAWDQQIPTDYHDVKEQIEKEFAKEHKNHITRQQFDKIADKVIKAEREALLKSLTCLGICLWYPNIRGIDFLVLNPEWITRGIYRIVNWLNESGRTDASISLEEFKQAFSTMENDYPQNKHSFLFGLMQNYELAYKKSYCEDIVIPQCLPEDSPARTDLPDFPQETSLYVEITANKSGNEGTRLTFPPDVLPRFIVHRSDDLKDCPIWRYGAVLRKGNITALIEQEDFLIKLHVKGNERRDYLGEFLYTLMAVLSDYPSFASEKPEVSCCIAGSNGGSREMIPLIQVINYVQYMESEKRNSYFDPGRRMEITLDNAKMYLSPKVNNYFVYANQANIAPNGSITATQNNGINADELTRLINDLKAAVPKETNEEDRSTINESVAAVEEELKKEKPRKGVVNTMLTGIKGIIRTAEFGAAVAAIVNFVGTL